MNKSARTLNSQREPGLSLLLSPKIQKAKKLWESEKLKNNFSVVENLFFKGFIEGLERVNLRDIYNGK